MSDSREERAAARRATMKVRWTTLDDESDPWPVTGTDGFLLVWTLSRDVWLFAGRHVTVGPQNRGVFRFVPRAEADG